jgi:hypothetical protein
MAKTAFLHPFARPAADEFVNIVRGEGAAVWDDDGNRYVDAMASLWYCQVGHGRLEIAEAVAAQMGALEAFHTFEMFTNDPAERLCAALAKRSPMPDTRVFLTDSGSGGGGDRAQAQPAVLGVAGSARTTGGHRSSTGLPRGWLRRHHRPGAARQPRRVGASCWPTSCTPRPTTWPR